MEFEGAVSPSLFACSAHYQRGTGGLDIEPAPLPYRKLRIYHMHSYLDKATRNKKEWSYDSLQGRAKSKVNKASLDIT